MSYKIRGEFLFLATLFKPKPTNIKHSTSIILKAEDLEKNLQTKK